MTVLETRGPSNLQATLPRPRKSWLSLLARRPELAAMVVALAVAVFFSIASPVFRSPEGIAIWLQPAATMAIMAVAVSLLMIGGEFDLSAGVITGTTSLTTAMLVTSAGWNIWAALGASLALAVAIGLFNGYLVVSTRLPSFIVTLATFLGLQGLNLGVTKLITGTTQVQGLSASDGFDVVHALFGSSITIAGAQFSVVILWSIAITAVGAYALGRARGGNWVLAVGGSPSSARAVGIPVKKVKISLFLTTATAGWLVGTMLLVQLDSVQATTGVGQELIYVVAAVIGGCLLMGGHGSVLGASIGALIFGMAQLGIVYAGWDSDWFKAFLGGMLLLAVLSNEFVKRLLTTRGRMSGPRKAGGPNRNSVSSAVQGLLQRERQA